MTSSAWSTALHGVRPAFTDSERYEARGHQDHPHTACHSRCCAAPATLGADVIATRFHDYQHSPTVQCIGGKCSPALLALRVDLQKRWGLESLGCYGPRTVRGSTSASTHTWGAAIDLSYGELDAKQLENVCGYLVGWSEEWGLQAIHDYHGSRIWRAGRTTNPADACSTWWRAQRRDPNGMGQPWANWLHLEIHPNRWWDARTADERGVV